MRLILFDIDGTLLTSNGAGIATLAFALQEIFGTTGSIDRVDFAGKTDPSIITEILSTAGIDGSRIQAELHRIYEHMAHSALDIFPTRGVMPCSGVPQLLDELQQRPDVILGLVTGNNHLTGPLKLASAGIAPELFRVAAFGSDAADRNRLPSIAMERARELTGYPFKGAQTVVVGDTPADIECARHCGATAVAVATGRFDYQTLAVHSPDFCFDTLVDTPRVLGALLKEQVVAQ
ncbi:MAG TPA: HAD family hydrolase [Candidatus Binatia bacterium]|jgi:phosphoglycolate phosphatase-like HAD superfamily hydrolase|nr:HAD family hydrolase [Candidatus Binatia bacterium]